MVTRRPRRSVYTARAMFRVAAIPLLLLAPALFAQQQSGPRAERNTRLLLERVAAAPRMNLTLDRLKLQPPMRGWAVEMVSSVAVGPDNVHYLLQRGADADPVIAVNAEGRVLRSWGAGLFTIPHSIRRRSRRQRLDGRLGQLADLQVQPARRATAAHRRRRDAGQGQRLSRHG